MTAERFAEEYTAGSKMLLRHLVQFTGRDHAEDIASEAWLRAWKCREQFNGESRFMSWVFVIAKNVWLEFRRNNRRHMDDAPGSAALMDSVAQHDRVQLAAEIDIEDLIKPLPALTRRMIRMKFVLEMQSSEISEELQMNGNTVKTTLFRGYLKIRKRIER